MKKLIIIFLFISLTGCVIADSCDIRLKAIRYNCMFISGYADGMNDAISFHYYGFAKMHPHAQEQFWNPAISWKNKYNGNKLNQTLFVFKTDGFHLTNMLSRTFMIGGAMVIPMKKQKWWWYGKEFAIDYLIDRIGFFVAYNLIYK